MVALVVFVSYKSLRFAGFQLRWENPDQGLEHDLEDRQSLVEVARATFPDGFRPSQPVPAGELSQEGELALVAENA